jgi:hypothetical protein
MSHLTWCSRGRYELGLGCLLFIALSALIPEQSMGPEPVAGQAGVAFPQLNDVRTHAARRSTPSVGSTGLRGGASPRLVEAYGHLPLSFEPNRGQTHAPAKFLSRGPGYTLFLTGDEAVLALPSHQASVRSGQFTGDRNSRLETGDWQSQFENRGSVALRRLLAGPADYGPRTTDGLLGFSIDNLRSIVDQRRVPSPTARTPAFLRMKLIGANPHARVTGLDELPGKTNYFIGSDPKKWRTNIPNYAKVKYQDIYPGIDLVYYGSQRELEYDFVVAPGADPSAIALEIVGEGSGLPRAAGGRPYIAENGDLVITIDAGAVRFHRPVVYQPATNPESRTPNPGSFNHQSSIDSRQLRSGRYTLTANNQVGFEVGAYDPTLPLVIDPTLNYSTYLGGLGFDSAFGIAIDSSGNAYLTGETVSADFPTANPIQPSLLGVSQAFVAKLDPSGSALIYSTYLGGTGGDNSGSRIALDSAGNAYVVGQTNSTDFPTVNPIQPALAGSADAFVAKLDDAGSALMFSTYLGGALYDAATGIVVDASGNAYVAGMTASSDFPVLNAFQPRSGGFGDAFVTKLNASGSALVYSTYLGGRTDDWAAGIAIDASRDIYVAGTAYSDDFPTANPLQPRNAGGYDVFVTKLNASGSELVYSTYLGGTGTDYGYDIALDPSGNAYVTGQTASSDFPLANAFQTAIATSPDAFVTKLDANGSALVYSTYLGGNSTEWASSIAIDSTGSAFVAGMTQSTDFPTAAPIQPSNPAGSEDAFVTKFNAAGSALLYSTYFGGSFNDAADAIAVDSSGNVYVTGQTLSIDFPLKNPLQASHDGFGNAFVTKFSQALLAALSSTTLDFGQRIVGATATQTVTLTNAGEAALNISNISIADPSGDFPQTNNCGTSLAPGGNCTITVTFDPTAVGTRAGTLTITDNAPGSPHTVALSGIGTDFAVGAASGGSTTATVTAGGTATYNLSLVPSGFVGTAALSCAWQTQQPRGTNCTVSPTSVSLDGTTAAPFTVNVTTTARSMAGPQPHGRPGARGRHLILPLMVSLFGLAVFAALVAPRRQRVYVGLAASLVLITLWASCGGRGGGGAPPQSGTPAGSYSLAVTATASGASRSATLTLQVN